MSFAMPLPLVSVMSWSPSFVSLGFWYFPFLLKVQRSVTLDEVAEEQDDEDDEDEEEVAGLAHRHNTQHILIICVMCVACVVCFCIYWNASEQKWHCDL